MGTQASNDTLKSDMIANDSTSLDSDTVLSYVNALKKIFVVEESPAWNPNLRSKTAIRTSDTRYFIDPSIAVASLGIGPKDLINDLNTFGLLFETLCIRDLRVYAESIKGKVYHYRDANDLECDAVIHLRDGSYGLIEIKLGGDSLINEGADTLKKLESRIDITKMKNPSLSLLFVHWRACRFTDTEADVRHRPADLRRKECRTPARPAPRPGPPSRWPDCCTQR